MIAYLESPLQLMCAIEFHKQSQKIKKFYIRREKYETDIQIDYLLRKYDSLQIEVFFLPPLKIRNTFSWFIFIASNFYKKVLVGNLEGKVSLFFPFKLLTDDGAKSISIIHRKNYKKYWTFFDLKNLKAHSFEFFREFFKIDEINKENLVYFVGQKLVEANLLKNDQYLNMLKKVSLKYNKQKLFYFKHRGENNENLEKIEKMGFTIKSLEYPIEFYPIETKRLPSHVIGVASTALITFNIIYDSKISFIKLNSLVEKTTKKNNYLELYNYLGKFGKEIKI